MVCCNVLFKILLIILAFNHICLAEQNEQPLSKEIESPKLDDVNLKKLTHTLSLRKQINNFNPRTQSRTNLNNNRNKKQELHMVKSKLHDNRPIQINPTSQALDEGGTKIVKLKRLKEFTRSEPVAENFYDKKTIPKHSKSISTLSEKENKASLKSSKNICNKNNNPPIKKEDCVNLGKQPPSKINPKIKEIHQDSSTNVRQNKHNKVIKTIAVKYSNKDNDNSDEESITEISDYVVNNNSDSDNHENADNITDDSILNEEQFQNNYNDSDTEVVKSEELLDSDELNAAHSVDDLNISDNGKYIADEFKNLSYASSKNINAPVSDVVLSSKDDKSTFDDIEEDKDIDEKLKTDNLNFKLKLNPKFDEASADHKKTTNVKQDLKKKKYNVRKKYFKHDSEYNKLYSQDQDVKTISKTDAIIEAKNINQASKKDNENNFKNELEPNKESPKIQVKINNDTKKDTVTAEDHNHPAKTALNTDKKEHSETVPEDPTNKINEFSEKNVNKVKLKQKMDKLKKNKKIEDFKKELRNIQKPAFKSSVSTTIIIVCIVIIGVAIFITIVGYNFRQIRLEHSRYENHRLLPTEEDDEDERALFNRHSYSRHQNSYESWNDIA